MSIPFRTVGKINSGLKIFGDLQWSQGCTGDGERLLRLLNADFGLSRVFLDCPH